MQRSAQPTAAPRLDPTLWLGPASVSAWHDYRRAARIAERSERTVQGYGEALAGLACWLGDGRPGAEILDIGQDTAAAYLLHVSARHSAGTRTNRQRSLSAWYGWAAKEGIVSVSPFRGIPYADPGHRAPEVLTAGELRAIIATAAKRADTPAAEFCRVRDAAILRLMCEAGCPRRAELVSIGLADVDLSRDRVLLHGKGRKDRHIFMSPQTAQAVSRYIRARARWAAEHRIASPKLWLGQVPGRDRRWELGPSGVRTMVAERGMAALGKHIHPHQLRHTAYDRFDAAGGNPNDAMALFGWSSDHMTRVYGRTARERRALDAAERLSIGDL